MAEIAANGYNIGFDEVYMGNNSAENSNNANYKVVNKGNYSVSVPVTEDGGVPQDASKKKIGEVLIEMGLITEEQLFDALVTSKKSGNPIGSVLVQKNYIEQSEAVVTTTTNFNSLLLEHTKTRSSFTGIENASMSAFQQFDITSCTRGNTTHTLHNIKHQTLGLQ